MWMQGPRVAAGQRSRNIRFEVGGRKCACEERGLQLGSGACGGGRANTGMLKTKRNSGRMLKTKRK